MLIATRPAPTRFAGVHLGRRDDATSFKYEGHWYHGDGEDVSDVRQAKDIFWPAIRAFYVGIPERANLSNIPKQTAAYAALAAKEPNNRFCDAFERQNSQECFTLLKNPEVQLGEEDNPDEKDLSNRLKKPGVMAIFSEALGDEAMAKLFIHRILAHLPGKSSPKTDNTLPQDKQRRKSATF